MGNGFITKKIALPLGSYQISEFYILAGLESIIYASPLEGSLLAQNVTHPLPILFDVTEKKSKAVDVEVLSTENLNPADFGLVRFPLIGVETFQFLINVSELGTDQLLIADLTVTSGSYAYAQELEAIVDNIVTVKDGYEEYIISVDKEGYEGFTVTLTNSELKQYGSVPLVVELEQTNVYAELTYDHYDIVCQKSLSGYYLNGNLVWTNRAELKVYIRNDGNAIANDVKVKFNCDLDSVSFYRGTSIDDINSSRNQDGSLKICYNEFVPFPFIPADGNPYGTFNCFSQCGGALNFYLYWPTSFIAGREIPIKLQIVESSNTFNASFNYIIQ